MKRKLIKLSLIITVLAISIVSVSILVPIIAASEADYSFTINENDEIIAKKSPDGDIDGNLFYNLEAEGEEVLLGKTYEERINISNSGNADFYCRCVINKTFENPYDESMSFEDLNPDLIELKMNKNSDWIIDQGKSTNEKIVAYYKKPLKKGETTSNLIEGIKINYKGTDKILEASSAADRCIRNYCDY